MNNNMPEQDFERQYWNDCTNTFDEDQKHYVYARGMKLDREHYSFNVHGKRILDIGGGPTSMLLKTKNLIQGRVCDPLDFPAWVYARYSVKKIQFCQIAGEHIDESGWDEAWIYNCLQHTDDPAEILRRAKAAAPIVRIFEWIDIPPHEGHPQMITKELIDGALGVYGETAFFNESGCHGRAYFGCFDFRTP
jgi:hypothetical protein